ncbi:MAG: hypothetical protein KC503_20085, partial [Myxococcales bacterium]|nr:hypothetical protein [Myxococcales bacterium]
MAFDDVEARAQAIWPALQIERRLARSSKSDLFAATLDGEQVVLKALSSTQPLWRYYLAREIAAYDALQGEALPFAIPRCYGADLERGLLLLSACDGRRLANGRAASRPLPPAIVEHLVRGLRALAR